VRAMLALGLTGRRPIVAPVPPAILDR
jgi:hypothetical protein